MRWCARSPRTAPTTALRWTATPTACRWWTRAGRLYNGDELLYLLVADRLARATSRARRGGHADDQHGGGAGAEGARRDFVRAKVGDRYVLEELTSTGGCWAAKARATCWRWTSTPPATA
jgi:hypothetical protein